MKHLNLFFAACLLSLGLQAETVWHNPQTEKLTGVNNVHILDGRVLHSLLLEIFTHDGVGSMILK